MLVPRSRLAQVILTAAGLMAPLACAAVADADVQVLIATSVPPHEPAIEQPLPTYPPDAARLGIEKDLDVRVTVDTEGRATAATIVGGTLLSRPENQGAQWFEFVADHSRAFDEATVAAARCTLNRPPRPRRTASCCSMPPLARMAP